MVLKMKIRMLLDTKGERGGGLWSGTIHNVSEEFGKKMIKQGRAILYNEITDAKRIVRLVGVDGKVKEITWSEYIKMKINQRRKKK